MLPAPNDILSGLGTLANSYFQFAIAWHAILSVFAVVLLLGKRPGQRHMAIASCLPLISVGVFAWISGNPFNGSVFLILTTLLCWYAFKIDLQPIAAKRGWPFMTGILLFVFGLIYPHFLETSSFWSFLYEAPTGLIPCPTLSVVIGGALIFGGYGSRSWSIALAAGGLFYGLFGVLRLEVLLDLVLVAGSLALLYESFTAIKNRNQDGTAS